MIKNLHIARLKTQVEQFQREARGSVTVEMVITLPLLFWMLWATYEFFEIHRYQSARDKATYTVADMLSREQDVVTPTYIDNVKVLFDQIANDDGVNQIRVSVIEFDEANDEYDAVWSEVRGPGQLAPFAEGAISDGHSKLPKMRNAEQVILVESLTVYQPRLDLVFDDTIPMESRVFTSLRFSPQLCFDKCKDL
ncbi:MAG: pilus assembly protein [Pseudomonadota bacterium]